MYSLPLCPPSLHNFTKLVSSFRGCILAVSMSLDMSAGPPKQVICESIGGSTTGRLASGFISCVTPEQMKQ